MMPHFQAMGKQPQRQLEEKLFSLSNWNTTPTLASSTWSSLAQLTPSFFSIFLLCCIQMGFIEKIQNVPMGIDKEISEPKNFQ